MCILAALFWWRACEIYPPLVVSDRRKCCCFHPSAGRSARVNLQEPAGVVARSKGGASSLSPLPPGAYSPKPLAEVLLDLHSCCVDFVVRFGERGGRHRRMRLIRFL